MSPSLTILLPCHNEEVAVVGVVREYRSCFPSADILVVDNASTDRTAELARAAGAQVISEPRKGKAQAVLRAFAHIQTDLILMADGDGSYPAESARLLVDAHDPSSDMTTGIRRADPGKKVFRPLHQAGTDAFGWCAGIAFGFHSRDLFSGLRVFSRCFYKNAPILSRGFELEMELTVQAVDKGFRIHEIEIPFREREGGTPSKLHTFRDGWRILTNLVQLFRDYKPLLFFGVLSAVFFACGLLAGAPPVYGYWQTGFVNRFPLAILAAAFMNLSLFTLLTGFIAQSGLRHHREAFQVMLRNFPR